MSARSDARTALAYLERLCDLIDARRPLSRIRREWWTVAAPVAAGLAMCAQGCGGTVESTPQNSAPVEDCHDGVDNDGDGQIDCWDADCEECSAHPDASVPEASTPDQTAPDQGISAPAEVCDDGLDNDFDGLTDCLDVSCFASCGCAMVEACTNGLDDDCDGMTDCLDPACAYDVCCGTDSLYSAPGPGPEACANGLDDDCDGAIDCADPECASNTCCAGAPPPELCGNGLDDDCDGAVDCADSDCASAGCSCADPNECPLPSSACATRTCQNGTCSSALIEGMVFDSSPGDCRSPYCNASGQVYEGGNDGDSPMSEACRSIMCMDMSIQYYSAQAGTPCGQGLACDGNGECVGCSDASSCPVGNGCRQPNCQEGKCGFDNLPEGYVGNDQQPNDCRTLACSSGRPVPVASDQDTPDDGIDCTWDVCTNGMASHPPRPAGTPCSQDGGTACDGTGQCL